MGLLSTGRPDAASEARGDLAYGTAFIIEELTGQKRTITLTGRCLPHRGTVTPTMTHRFKKTLYAGSDEATIQMLGVDPKGLTVSGEFLTRYMNEDGFTVSTNGSAARAVRTAEEARSIFWSVCAEGQEVRVCWGQGEYQTVRRGIVANVPTPEERATQIGWSLEFEWTSVRDSRPRVRVEAQPERPRKATSAFDDLMGVLNGVADAAAETRGMVNRALLRLNDAAEQLADLNARWSDLAATPAQMARQTAIVAGNMVAAISDAQTAAVATSTSYSRAAAAWQSTATNAAFLPFLATGGVVDDALESQTSATIAALEVQSAIRRALVEARRLADRAAAMEAPDVKALHPVCDGDTLRSVSVRYYGTADHWQDLADRNGLNEDDLSGVPVLIIPEAFE